MTAIFLTHPALTARHGFFTRQGGVSSGNFASLNANLAGGDAAENVRANRARIALALGVPPENLLGVKQVHGTKTITVDALWPAGQGPDADALVTNHPGIALGVITADCGPILFHDATHKVIGAAHAGWRGAAAGILQSTLTAMSALGATPATTTAIIGPCIGQASYEVGPELRDTVLAASPEAGEFFVPGRPPDRLQFDLAGYCALRLRQAGVAAIHALGVDTCADPERFFSYRRKTLHNEGPIGHQLSAITL